MLKAIVLAATIITLASSAQAGGIRGIDGPLQRYERKKEARVNRHLQIENEQNRAANAAINAGMQKGGAKYDAAMNTATNDLQRGISSGVSSICTMCR